MHKLETPWTFWVSEHRQGVRGKVPNKQDYLRDVAKLCTVETVEEFWSVWRDSAKPDDLRIGTNVYLFRVGIKPMWEELPNGATWSIKMQRDPLMKEHLKYAWENAFLLCIGESLETTHLAGCSMTCKPTHYVISIWFDATPSSEEQISILENLKNSLRLPVDTILEFKENSSALIDGSSSANAKRYSITSHD